MQIITVEQMQRHLRKFKKKGNKLKHWMGAPLNRARKLDDGTYEMVISAPPVATIPAEAKKIIKANLDEAGKISKRRFAKHK